MEKREEEIDLYPGEISIADFKEKVGHKIKALRKHWISIMGVSLLFGVIGWFYAHNQPKYYTANVVFVLSTTNPQSNQNNIIAQQLGLSQTGNSEGGLFTIQNFLGLLTHGKMIRETLLSPYPTDSSRSFISKYIEFKGQMETKFPFEPISYQTLEKEQISILRNIGEEIKPFLVVKSMDDGTSFTQFSGRFENEEFAKYFTEALLEYTLQFYVSGKTKEIRKNLEQTEMRKDSLLKRLINKSRNIAQQSVQTIDLNPAYSASVVENQVMSNEGAFMGKLYAETLASLEILRSELRQQTPIFTMIEGAETPLPLEVQPTMRWFLAMFVLGMLGSIVFFGIRG